MLSETYGIMVYQGQVMQTAQILGGYSLVVPTCCAVRWARKGRGNGRTPREVPRRCPGCPTAFHTGQGRRVFDLMEKFAGYSFNKSHAAAYAAGLPHRLAEGALHGRVHAANMTVEMDNTDKLAVAACRCAELRHQLPAARCEPGHLPLSRSATPVCATGWGPSRARASRPSSIWWPRAPGAAVHLAVRFCRVDKGRVNKRTVGGPHQGRCI